MLAAAPLSWQLKGTQVTTPSQRVSFLMPPSWSLTTYRDGVAIRTPMVNGVQCEILVLEPRAAAATEQGQWEQLALLTKGILPAGDADLRGEYGSSDLLHTKRRGKSGAGWSFVGLVLEWGSTRIDPWLAVFGNQAVPVIPFAPGGTNCLLSHQGRVDAATVFHSLDLDRFPAAPATYREPLLGSWFTSDGRTGVLYASAANGHYVDVAATSGTIIESGQIYDVFSSFAGAGRYFVYGSLVARFPTTVSSTEKNHSNFVRIYEEQSSVTNVVECEIHVSSIDGSPYEICLWKST